MATPRHGTFQSPVLVYVMSKAIKFILTRWPFCSCLFELRVFFASLLFSSSKFESCSDPEPIPCLHCPGCVSKSTFVTLHNGNRLPITRLSRNTPNEDVNSSLWTWTIGSESMRYSFRFEVEKRELQCNNRERARRKGK